MYSFSALVPSSHSATRFYTKRSNHALRINYPNPLAPQAIRTSSPCWIGAEKMMGETTPWPGLLNYDAFHPASSSSSEPLRLCQDPIRWTWGPLYGPLLPNVPLICSSLSSVLNGYDGVCSQAWPIGAACFQSFGLKAPVTVAVC